MNILWSINYQNINNKRKYNIALFAYKFVVVEAPIILKSNYLLGKFIQIVQREKRTFGIVVVLLLFHPKNNSNEEEFMKHYAIQIHII